MNNKNLDWRTGDWIQVKSADEISRTLDAAGTLDGLPFMPEMLSHCGHRYRLLRKAEKTCVEVPIGTYAIREFQNNDVYLLDVPRCSGSEHDGCQRLCMFFWKRAWLTTADGDERVNRQEIEGDSRLRAVLKTMSAPGRYFCQSTELSKATKPGPIPAFPILLKCIREVRSGAVSVTEMIRLIMVPLYRKVRDRLVGRPYLLGTLSRTPVGNLGLQPGELVEIKSQREMQETLDRKGRNRGLVCDIELKTFSGMRYRVLSRLDRMISEPTGEMRKVEGTVFLDSNTCMCARALGGCPRQEFCFWREVWLKRVEPVTSLHSRSETQMKEGSVQ